MSKLNPCPICGSEVESNISFGAAQINCKNHDCIMIGCIMMNEPFVDEIERKWNDSYSSQQLAKLKAENEKYKWALEKITDLHAEDGSIMQRYAYDALDK